MSQAPTRDDGTPEVNTTHRKTGKGVDGRFHCSCGKSYTRAADVNRHISGQEGGRCYSCAYPGCSKSFPYEWGLNAHILTHGSEKSYQCELLDLCDDGTVSLCTKTYKSSSSLSRHQSRHHDSQKKRKPIQSVPGVGTTPRGVIDATPLAALVVPSQGPSRDILQQAIAGSPQGIHQQMNWDVAMTLPTTAESPLLHMSNSFATHTHSGNISEPLTWVQTGHDDQVGMPQVASIPHDNFLETAALLPSHQSHADAPPDFSNYNHPTPVRPPYGPHAGNINAPLMGSANLPELLEGSSSGAPLWSDHSRSREPVYSPLGSATSSEEDPNHVPAVELFAPPPVLAYNLDGFSMPSSSCDHYDDSFPSGSYPNGGY